MEEKVLKKSKNGLAMVTLFILLYAAAIAAIIVGSIMVEQRSEERRVGKECRSR